MEQETTSPPPALIRGPRRAAACLGILLISSHAILAGLFGLILHGYGLAMARPHWDDPVMPFARSAFLGILPAVVFTVCMWPVLSFMRAPLQFRAILACSIGPTLCLLLVSCFLMVLMGTPPEGIFASLAISGATGWGASCIVFQFMKILERRDRTGD